jgi:hypothetical protein
LQALTEVLKAVTTEAFSVHVLRALQAMAAVAGVLDMKAAVHAVIAAVCSFTVDAPPSTSGNAKGNVGVWESASPAPATSSGVTNESSASSVVTPVLRMYESISHVPYNRDLENGDCL